MKRLAIVVPCYREEEVLLETTRQLTAVLSGLETERLIAPDSFILFVNDGSDDQTWPIITQLYEQNKYVCGLNLAGNVGHQNAIVAGLTTAVDCCDAAITIDADLQDDVSAIRDMVMEFENGNDIVYGVRASRKTDSFFKRCTAESFYKLMMVMGVKTVYNHADYRLMSKRAIQYLLQFTERNVFLRGIVPLVGYRTANVYYDRAERFAGETKYPLSKMIALAFNGITSFTTKPVHLVLYMGLLFLVISVFIFLWVIWNLVSGNAIQGWASLILSIWFCSGCVLTGLGIIGEYIGQIYVEVKNRPRFNVESVLMK